MTDVIQLHFPVVDPKGPALHEAVYKDQNVTVWAGGATAYLVMMGYIVQTWAALMHRPWAGNRIVKQHITGDFEFDVSEMASQAAGKEWRVSNVAINLTAYPAKGNIIFGQPGVFHAGYFAWFQSTIQQDGLDWTLDPITAGGGFQTTGFIGLNLQAPYPNLITTGIQPTTQDTVANGIWNTQLQQQPASFEVGIQSWGSVPPVKKSKFITATVTNPESWLYPLQWLNWDHMWMEAPNPNINGFVLKLKPGVMASINIGLTRRDPQISYGNVEVEHGAFNPMKGGPQ